VGNFTTIKFKAVGLEVKGISLVDKNTGKLRKADFAVNGDEIVVFEPFEYLSTQTLILE
jgi:hypothetical protein